MTGIAELIVNKGERAEIPIAIDYHSNTYRTLIGLSQGRCCSQSFS